MMILLIVYSKLTTSYNVLKIKLITLKNILMKQYNKNYNKIINKTTINKN